MPRPSSHISIRSFRRLGGLALTVVYALIVMSSLLPLAMGSKMVAHAVTGECSGECDIDGCSLESRANHSCCCARKKPGQAVIVKGSCCTAPQPDVAKKDCCSTTVQHQHDEKTPEIGRKAATTRSETVYKCGSPCGNGRFIAIAGAGSSELLPCRYAEKIVPPHKNSHYPILSQSMISRHAEPPEPPPIISHIS